MDEIEFDIPLEELCRIVQRAREYEAQVPAVDPDDGSNPSDDGAVVVLEDESNETVEEELRAAIDDLSDDAQRELVALVLVGRGTFEAAEWQEALDSVEDEAPDIAGWLLDQPMLAGLIDAGMAAFELSCDEAGKLG